MFNTRTKYGKYFHAPMYYYSLFNLFQYANVAFEKLTGYSRKDVIGRTTRLGPYPSNCKDSGSVSLFDFFPSTCPFLLVFTPPAKLEI